MQMGYREFFERLTGHAPYGFQADIGERILAGESLIFRAPTGAGKTWTTVAPFLYSQRHGQRLADRLIYAVPLRSLASGLHATVSIALKKQFETCDKGKERAYGGAEVYCSLQMGGEKNDPFFEGDLVFCTIDQLLSGYLMMPVSLPPKLDNIVAGALIGSLVILDEAHLLDAGVALGTVIEMMNRLKGLVQFVLMTATMSDSSMAKLAGMMGAKVPKLRVDEIRSLPVQRTKRRTWAWRSELLDGQAVKAAHRGDRTLVIVNRTTRAQDLYWELEAAYRGSSTKVACLHSRFFAADRRGTEDQLQSWFGRDATETNVILVTTQVVEAGLDISADRILTELAPMNALVQRAGRTARYVERCTGEVVVFEVETDRPYEDKAAFDATRKCLGSLWAEGENIDFEREQAWVDTVHGRIESDILRRYANLRQREKNVEEAISTGHRGKLGELVRDIDTVSVLLSAKPSEVRFGREMWPSLLSVPRTSIRQLGRSIESGSGAVWMAKSPDDEGSLALFDWLPVEHAASLSGAWLIALGPAVAAYTEKAGLRLCQCGNEKPVRYEDLPQYPRYSYRRETWIDHVSRVLEQGERMAGANAVGSRLLDARLEMDPGRTEDLVRLAIGLHDLGKLTEGWQAKAWECEGGFGKMPGEALAHTNKEKGQKGPVMPHHAVEGAMAARDFLESELGDTAWAVARAIAGHHSARAANADAFVMVPEAAELVRGFGWNGFFMTGRATLADRKDFSEQLARIWEDENEHSWQLYAYLARRLRLADQAGTAAGVSEESKKA